MKTYPRLESLAEMLSPVISEKLLQQIPQEMMETIQEIRIQEGREISLVFPDRIVLLSKVTGRNAAVPVSHQQLEETFASLCEYSVHTYLPQIQNGFITTPEGHRVGIGGTAVIKDGKVSSFQKITSLNIRLAREETKLPEILKDVFGDGLCSVLIAGAPSSGKTTLLRALALWLAKYYRVTVVDERGEIMGHPSAEREGCLDVLTGFPKHIGILQAVRTLSPQVIICDELGDRQEVEQLLQALAPTLERDYGVDTASLSVEQAERQALNCGVSVVASIHAQDEEQLSRKPQYQDLYRAAAFDKVVFLSGACCPGRVRKVICCKQDKGLVKD